MSSAFYGNVEQALSDIEASGMTKHERLIDSPQGASIHLEDGTESINFCANNYLGLSNDSRLKEAAKNGIDRYGYGLSSVRFICGTQTVHHELERVIADFLKMEASILFPSCFDANAALFESLLTAEDAIISDQLNHASIIDGIRLCKAKRYRYANNNMDALEVELKKAKEDGARHTVIVTDGVFSMDGIIANLKGVCDLADKYGALVAVDDSHATGFVGKHGRGTPEFCGVEGRVDILTGTLGKALGGASGGYIAAKKPVVELLKQRARPYLFSNAVPPMIAAASVKSLEIVAEADDLRQQLETNKKHFRDGMEAAGFDLIPGHHAIVPVMLYDEKKAAKMANSLMHEGIYVTAFTYPVVPKGTARIRTQISAAHTEDQIDKAIAAFTHVRDNMEAAA
jgi:glycine C-acetyltransferase